MMASSQAKRIRESRNDRIFIRCVYAVLILVILLCAYPLYLTVIASISDPYDVYNGKVNLFPSGFTLDSYKLVFQNRTIWEGYANSIFYTVTGTLFNLFLTIPSAYALSRKRMFGRNLLMTVFLITMYFGGGMIPQYMLYRNMLLINTRWVLILDGALSVYNMIVTRTYIQSNIPEELLEAGRIDGSSELQSFFRLVLPLCGPITAVMTLYYAVGHWSSYFPAMIYTSDQKLQPLQLVLRKILILNQNAYTDAMSSGDAELMQDAARQAYMAVTMKYSLVFIASAPMLIAYPFVQKYFVKGIMVGSLKG